MTRVLIKRPARPDPTSPVHRAAGARRAAATDRHATPPMLNPRIVAATAHRVLLQLRSDRRTVAMLVVVPSLLLALINQMFDSQPRFDAIALSLIGIFPFTLMFLITSVAMLRERTGGTLERLLTTPASKLDLLLGYGVAFGVAGVVQAGVTCATAYLLLGLSTPGSPVLVLLLAVAGALLGLGIGLFVSAFATSEFQAVQFMPVVVMPQIFLGGLFVPREQMADWLETISDFLPLTYSIDGLAEVGSTSLVTPELIRDVTVVLVLALAALTLAATTLKRRTGEPTPAQRRRRRLVPLVVLALGAGLVANHAFDASRYVTTENALVDGQQMPIVAPAAGTLRDWRATLGTAVREDQPVGRLQLDGSSRPRMLLRAPADGTVVTSDVVDGAYVTAGTRLAVVYDLAQTYVTARVDESDLGGVRVGGRADVVLDADPDRTLTGYVREVQGATAALFAADPPDNTTAAFDRVTQLVPVRITITDPQGLTLLPGMNVTARIHRN